VAPRCPDRLDHGLRRPATERSEGPAIRRHPRKHTPDRARDPRLRKLKATKSDWNKWSADRWKPALRAAGLPTNAIPYDLRHSVAWLLLAELRQPQYVARLLGHSVAVLYKHHAHLIEEFEGATSFDAEAEIWAARRAGVRQECAKSPKSVPTEPSYEIGLTPKAPSQRGFRVKYRYRDSNPGYRRERAAS
jgi:hypothetical protein